MTSTPAIVFYRHTGSLVLTTQAFDKGELFDPHSGIGMWWHLSWAIKSADQSLIEAKQRQIGARNVPIGCILFVSPHMWEHASPWKEEQFRWIGTKLMEHPTGVYIPSEIIHAEWIGGPANSPDPWRLRVKPAQEQAPAEGTIRQQTRPYRMDTSPAFI